MAHICEICSKSFGLRKNLLRHKRSVHEKIKYSCNKCGRTFARSDYLQRHVRHHEDGKATEARPTYPGNLVDHDRAATHVTVAAQVGDVVPWTADTNVLLVAPAVLCGLQFPSWWSRTMALQYLHLNEGTIQTLRMAQHAVVGEMRERAEQARSWAEEQRTPDLEEVVILSDGE